MRAIAATSAAGSNRHCPELLRTDSTSSTCLRAQASDHPEYPSLPNKVASKPCNALLQFNHFSLMPARPDQRDKPH